MPQSSMPKRSSGTSPIPPNQQQQHQSHQPSNRRPSSPPTRVNPFPIALLFMGACMIISAIILGSRVTKLSDVILNKAFANETLSSLSVNTPIDSPYLNENQAAQYLGFSDGQIVKDLIEEGAFAGYVTLTNPTPEATYIISKDALDTWFKTYCRKEPGKPVSVSPTPTVNNSANSNNNNNNSNSSSDSSSSSNSSDSSSRKST